MTGPEAAKEDCRAIDLRLAFMVAAPIMRVRLGMWRCRCGREAVNDDGGPGMSELPRIANRKP